MSGQIKKAVASIAIGLGLLAPVMVPAIVSAQATDAVNCGANLSIKDVGSTANCPVSTVGGTKVEGIIKLAINLFSVVVGIISVFMIIIGGLKYITSSGESSNVQGAKNTIMYAVIGLVVVAIAQFIVKYVLEQASKATV